MIQHRPLRFEIKNFGPIISGSFKLHPLTIFIGPNNSGKSYAAMLVYSIIRALRGRIGEQFMFFWGRTIPSSLQELIDQMFSSRILDHLRSYFGCRNLRDLISWFASEQSAQVGIYLDDSNYPMIHIVGNSDKWTVKTRIEMIQYLQLDLNQIREIWDHLMEDIRLPKFAFYLPAARSGVLQALIGLIFRTLDQMSRGYRVIGVPLLPGITGEFMSELFYMSVSMDGDKNKEGARVFRPRSLNEQRLLEEPEKSDEYFQNIMQVFQKITQVLEKQMIKGSVDFLSGDLPIREIVFETRWRRRKLTIPIGRVSSAILETAPLILWVKHLLEPGDVLIIEEPEAHLHPENVRRMARALVRLVRSGVTVICTTHSSMILRQISNYLLAAQAARKDRLGFTKHDLLDEREVGVYLFRLREDGIGSEIQPVPVEPGFGIPEDEFVRVSKEIGYEMYRWLRLIHRKDYGMKRID